jgi:hypothetical protein
VVLPSPAVALEAAPWHAASGEQPTRDRRSRSTATEDVCAGLGAREIAELRESPELRAAIAACRTAATMTDADEKPLLARVPSWLIAVAAAVAIAISAGIVWYYCIRRDTDVPWFLRSWWS